MGKTYQSVVLNAPVETVWATVRNFHDMSWAPNVVQKCNPVGNLKGDQIGARRILNDAFHETLLELSDLDHSFRYRIDDGPSPVSRSEVREYIGAVRLCPVTVGNATFFEWASKWDAQNNQAEEFCHGIYVALLGELKNKFS